jgi:hypothetical protein
MQQLEEQSEKIMLYSCITPQRPLTSPGLSSFNEPVLTSPMEAGLDCARSNASGGKCSILDISLLHKTIFNACSNMPSQVNPKVERWPTAKARRIATVEYAHPAVAAKREEIYSVIRDWLNSDDKDPPQTKDSDDWEALVTQGDISWRR